MLRINKGESNTLYVTVSELTTISDAKYLMRLTSNDNLDSKVVRLPPNMSGNLQRWDIFPLIEDDVDDLENGVVSLEVGTYDYEIFQTESLTGTTIDNIRVESGLMEVYGSGTTTPTFDDPNRIVTFE